MSWQTGAHAPHIVAAATGAAGLIAAGILGALAGFLWLPLLWLQLPLWLAGLWGVCVYPTLWAQRSGGELQNGQLYIRRGVCWRREWRIPLSALRGLEWWESPLHRFADCRTLILHYTGGRVFLPLLPREQAMVLWEQLEAVL